MKIIGGRYRSRNFYMPFGIRPTQNFIRKTIFDLLGQDVTGKSFADIFAGSGAMGFEAISRGAKEVVFVENDFKCKKVIDENIALLGFNDDLDCHCYFEVFKADGFASIKRFFSDQRKFDIVYIDPPYGRALAKKALKTISAYDILHPNCVLIIQCENKLILPDSAGRFTLFKTKNGGSTSLYFYQ